MAKEKPEPAIPKSDIAPYSDATKLYCAQWASLRLHNGLVYRDANWRHLHMETVVTRSWGKCYASCMILPHLGICAFLIPCREFRRSKSCDVYATRKVPSKPSKLPWLSIMLVLLWRVATMVAKNNSERNIMGYPWYWNSDILAEFLSDHQRDLDHHLQLLMIHDI